MTEPILAWHFARLDRVLLDGRRVRKGGVYRLAGGEEPRMCRVGYHACRRALDALYYAPGPIICRVELRGAILEQDDKLCASERKVLWWADAAYALHEFAVDEAERVLRAARKAWHEPDSRSWEALRVKRAWLEGRASDEELFAARSAADYAGPEECHPRDWFAQTAAWAALLPGPEVAARSAAESAATFADANGDDARTARIAQNRRLTTALKVLASNSLEAHG